MGVRVLAAVVAVSAVLTVSFAAQSVAAPHFSTPIIVDSLQKAKADAAVAKPQNLHPLPYPNNDDHAWVSQMHKLQREIEEHDETLKHLHSVAEGTKGHMEKLRRLQQLFHAMVSLHQSEQVLSLIDKKAGVLKGKVKAIGDQADDIVREREELKKQMQDSINGDASKLAALKKKLQAKANVLDALVTKRADVAGIVGEWRSHVDKLRAVHGLPPRSGETDTISIPELPRPPSESEDAEEEAAEENGAEQAAGGSGGAGEDGSGEPKHAAQEQVVADEAPAEKVVEAEEVTVSDKDLAATRKGIHELLTVHLPKVSADLQQHVSKATAFLETTEARLDEMEQ